MARYKSRHDKSGGYHSKKYIENTRASEEERYIPSYDQSKHSHENQTSHYVPKKENRENIFIDDEYNNYKEPEAAEEDYEYEDEEGGGPRRTKPIVIILTILLIIAVLAAGCYAVYNFVLKEPQVVETMPPTVKKIATKQEATKQEATKQEATVEPTESEEEKLDKLAAAYVADMSKDEKIYQMMIVDPETLTGVDVATLAGDTTKEALTKYPVGGVCMFSQNIEDKDQITEMIKNMQSYSKTPMFISVDEEGGTVSRVQEKLQTTDIANMFTYKDESEATATANAKKIAQAISKLGFNFNLAPVADVWTNKDSDVIGERAYSDDYEEASKLVSAAVKGFHEGNVLTSLKHFPGHGSASEDSHVQLAHINKTKEELLRDDLSPFKAGIAAGSDTVMIGHIIVDSMDEEKPATLSSVIVPELLRKELNYNGVIISDSMKMASVTESYSTDEIVKGLIADATIDLILCPSSIEDYHTAINTALTNGDIKQEMIDNSVTKIIKLKIKQGIIPESELKAADNNQKPTESVKSTSATTKAN